MRPDPETEQKNLVGSILKAARLLDCFTAETREVFLAEFADQTGYNKTTVYRLLQTLIAAGLLARTPNGGYRLGPKCLYLGAIARADVDLRREALPLMRSLAEEFGDTAFLMIPEREGAVVLEAIVGSNPVRIHGVTAGTVLPYHVAAGPTVLAAFSPEIENRVMAMPREQLTASTTTSSFELRARFQDVREHGYAVSIDDYVDDVSAVAAPVLGADGIAVGSLSLGGPSARFSGDDYLKRVIAKVKEAADELSGRVSS